MFLEQISKARAEKQYLLDSTPQGPYGQGIPEESLQKTLSTRQLMHCLHGHAQL